MTCILQIECVEPGLGFAKRYLHLTGLQHLIRMIRTDTQSQSSIYNVFTQA